MSFLFFVNKMKTFLFKASKLQIPDIAETQLKDEFAASRDLIGKVGLPRADLRAFKTTTNAEAKSFKSFKSPTRITMFLCPRAPSCSFSLSKAEMRTRNLPLDHLIQVCCLLLTKI